MKLGEAMYRAHQEGGDGDAGGDSGPGAAGGGAREGVVDAEFEEVDDTGRKRSA